MEKNDVNVKLLRPKDISLFIVYSYVFQLRKAKNMEKYDVNVKLCVQKVFVFLLRNVVWT
jgi:hypothetical protein